jgi:AcrR family transcriptional regulator
LSRLNRVSTRRRNPRGQGAALRDELLDAAETLLRERGDESRVSINDVVGAVGVTPPSLYAHFADKAALFVEVHARLMASFGEQLAGATAGIADPVDRLRARGRAYLEYARTHPESYRALFMSSAAAEAGDDLPERIMATTSYADLLANVQACIESGDIDVDPDDADAVSRTIWALVHGIASMAITMPNAWEPYGADAVLDRGFNGLMDGYRAG